ncbi:MAG TPA: hypothetical protein PK904_07305 [Bacteroidales bacterium]|nr:hypothetical protein [Bacteroidales bacterium]
MANLKTDLMGIIDFSQFPNKFEPYETEDGWTVVLPGENDGRKEAHGKKLVAESKVEIQLDSTANLLKCIQALEESDRRLRELRTGGPYDWQLVKIKDLTVKFGVSWYDLEFFNAKKDVWSQTEHSSMFQQFGVPIEKVSVQHFEL